MDLAGFDPQNPRGGSQASVAQVQFQGIWHSLLIPKDTRHTHGAQIHTQAKHIKIFLITNFNSYLSTRVEAVYKNKRKA